MNDDARTVEDEMTPREQDRQALPEMPVVVASVEDATALAPLWGLGEVARPVLVATGPDPMAVDAALDDLDAPAGRVLLPDGPSAGPAGEVAQLLPRFAAALADGVASDGPGVAAVVVRGGSPAALAATQVAVWHGVPVLALDAPALTRVEAANRAAVLGLTAWQTSEAGGMPYPARLDLLVHRCLDDARQRRVVCMPVTQSAMTRFSA
jgi:hypothetical protein